MTLLDALSRRKIRFRRSGSEIQVNCPWCLENRGEADTSFCFHLNVRSGAGHCWHASCGYKGRHVIPALLRQLNIQARVDTDAVEQPEPIAEPVELPDDFQVLTKATDDLDLKARRYLLHDRGITMEQIGRYRIGISYTGRYAYRIIMPVWVDKKLRGIVARDFTGRQQPKYLNSKGDKYLFGFDANAETVVLAEGIFKALRLQQAGWPAAALLGHDLTDIQLEQLQNSKCQKAILFPDPDPVGRQGVIHIADKLANAWSGKVEVVWPVVLPADEMPLEALRGVQIQPFNWAVSQRLRVP